MILRIQNFIEVPEGGEQLSLMIKGSNGHLGIGTNMPSTPLSIHANGANHQVGITQRKATSQGSSMEFTTADGTNNLQATRLSIDAEVNHHYSSFWKGASGSEEQFALFGSDNSSTYGIWVSPNNQTPAYMNFRYDLNTVGGSVGYDSADNLMKLVSRNSFTTSTFGLAIDLNGEVGINTEDPTEKLDVNGNIRVRSLSANPGSPLYITANGELTSSVSDVRLKRDIRTISNALDKTLSLRGVMYYWQDPDYPQREIGLIAQEVEEVLPEVVFINSSTGYKGVKYAEILAVLIEAIREQQTEIGNQQDEIQALRKETERITQLEKKLEQIMTQLEDSH